MALNPQYLAIGEQFAKQYYTLFDDPACRAQLINLYSPEMSLMSFEGSQHRGAQKIMEKFAALTFAKIQHIVTTVDCQPMFDGGILINVVGQLKTDDDPVHGFSQTFVLKPVPNGQGFFCQHDVFRLAIHNV
ncbi:probable nuclear transport factor 2 [Pollicipes pollicipes]|uniref:probable nuclear transport factor 2 n=1 Tax=Pollicipes pollicipes TaxID=41117 RepID=UPI001885160F|nr:probable nuclear transport factor 2 [Pollicipes pollicipes]